MTGQAEVLRQLLVCIWLGMAAGLLRSALHPLRARFPLLWQLVCCTAALAMWMHIVFGVCRADPGIGFFLGFAGGFQFWNITAGPLADAVFSRIWDLFAQWSRGFRSLILWIFHKIAFFRKYPFPRA